MLGHAVALLMPEEVHHHHYHHRKGGGCLIDVLIVVIVLAVIGSITSRTDGSGVEAVLGIAIFGYIAYRVFSGSGRGDSEDEE